MEFKDNKHWFKVNQTHITEPYKTPMGLFKENLVPSDLEDFDSILCQRLGIQKTIDEKALAKRRANNDKDNKRAHDKRINEE